MKTALIFILCLAAAHCIDLKEFGDEFVQKTKKLHDLCVAKINVTDSEIEQFKEGVYSVQNKLFKEYIACLWLESKAVDENLNVHEDVVKNFLPPSKTGHLAPAYVACIKLVKKTVPANTPVEEKFFLISNCVYFRNPEDWIFF
uniref:Odorant-binding protein 22 n=1 Tax=Pyrrhalta maculicollis TaxID=226885 RepID=A0A1J0KKA8_9CUCU|nr:odorant-binding protein 22 [Pyrrhalta maculicollis]